MNTDPAPSFAPGDIHPKSPLNGHPLANAFPMMAGADMEAHIESVKIKQLTPIVLHEGMVLDGRNTLFAILEAGLVPEFRTFGSRESDGDSPAFYVDAHNLKRRHMSPGARAAAAAKLVEFYEEEAKARKAGTHFKPASQIAPPTIAPAADAGSGDLGTAPAIHSEEVGAPAAAPPPVALAAIPGKGRGKKGSAVALAAEAAGSSPTSTKEALKLKRKHADLFEAVANNKMTLHEAMKEAAKRKKEAEGSVSAETMRHERIAAIKALEKRHGPNSAFVESVKEKKVLKKHLDLKKYADMKRAKAFSILPLIKIGMSVDKANAYLDAAATADSTVADMISMALVAHGDKPKGTAVRRVFVVNGWTVTLEREGNEEEEQTALDAAAGDNEPQGTEEPESELAAAADENLDGNAAPAEETAQASGEGETTS